MRTVTKQPIPEVLSENASDWLAEYVADPGSETKRNRYRHPDIKRSLRTETAWKCVYCESKIGHTSPGDIEHKIPSSKDVNLHFDWENLTVACTECNRRKSAYLIPDFEFLDPYKDTPETCLVHVGPFVFWAPGNDRAEITIRRLELHTHARFPLIERKLGTLEKARQLLDLAASPGAGGLLAELRRTELELMQASEAEYSAMVSQYIKNVAGEPSDQSALSPAVR